MKVKDPEVNNYNTIVNILKSNNDIKVNICCRVLNTKLA